MWYTGADSLVGIMRIGYATGPDGINWTRQNGDDPVLVADSTGWNTLHVRSPTVIFNPISIKYEMWYAGDYDSANRGRIGHATSTDGIIWDKDDSYVLDWGTSGAWDDRSIGYHTVLFDSTDPDAPYKMWYSGYSGGLPWEIGYATSLDGTNWTRDPENPVLNAGAPGVWDSRLVINPTVLLDGTGYKMWYEGSSSSDYLARIGLATTGQTPSSEPIPEPTTIVLMGLGLLGLLGVVIRQRRKR